MKTTSIIRAMERLGLTVEKRDCGDTGQSEYMTSNGDHIAEWFSYKGETSYLRVRSANDVDHFQSDYHAGVYVETITSALNLLGFSAAAQRTAPPTRAPVSELEIGKVYCYTLAKNAKRWLAYARSAQGTVALAALSGGDRGSESDWSPDAESWRHREIFLAEDQSPTITGKHATRRASRIGGSIQRTKQDPQWYPETIASGVPLRIVDVTA